MPLDNQVTSAPVITAPYHVDPSRGGHNGRVSSEWFSRPADQRYLNLSGLYASVVDSRVTSASGLYRCECQSSTPGIFHR